jgi:2-isopropylmalate synthase
LHVDPADIGKSYEKLIRINSQSGKGGIAFILEKEFGIFAPKQMHPEIGTVVQRIADEKGGEIDSQELFAAFEENFINIKGPYSLKAYDRNIINKDSGDLISVSVTVGFAGKLFELEGQGNGPISATVHALQKCDEVPDFVLEDFSEKSMGHDADAKAIAFVGIRRKRDGRLVYGGGEHSNIDRAAIYALFSALNRSSAIK